MKVKAYMIFAIVLAALSIYVGVNYADTTYKCGTCEVDSPCEGTIGHTDSLHKELDPWPDGCGDGVWPGGDCKGTCNVCDGGTAKNFCEYTGNESDPCIVHVQTIDCGDTTEYDCDGTWPDCTCDGGTGRDGGSECESVSKCSKDV
jgi:hypothetical protein